MEKNMAKNEKGTSKLALLRQKRDSITTKGSVNIEKAIEGFANSIDTTTMLAEIEENSALVKDIV